MRSLLIGLSLLLVAVVAVEWWYFFSRSGTWLPEPGPVPEVGKPGRILPVAEDFQLPALVSYDTIEERPLFVEGRRPPSEEPEEPEEVAVVANINPPSMTLLGVLITPDGRFALVRTQQPPEVKRLHEGDLVDGWKLAEIAPGRILVTQGEQKESLPLREYKYPAQPPAPPPKKKRTRAPRKKNTPAQKTTTNPRAFTPTFGRKDARQ